MNSLRSDFSKYLAAADSALLQTNVLLQRMENSQQVQTKLLLQKIEKTFRSYARKLGDGLTCVCSSIYVF